MSKVHPHSIPQLADSGVSKAKIIKVVIACVSVGLASLGIIAIAVYFSLFSYVPPAGCPNPFSGDTCDECGLVYNSTNVARISGGIEAVANSWPSAVYLTLTFDGYVQVGWRWYWVVKTFICGGTLINRNTILSAAHCVFETVEVSVNNVKYIVPITNSYSPNLATMFKAYLGAHNISGILSGKIPDGVIKMPIRDIALHEDYNSTSYFNDIALFRLSYDVQLNKNIQIACLPNPDYLDYPLTYNIDAWLIGWGSLNSSNIYPDLLQNTKTTLYDPATCFKLETKYFKDPSSLLCAGDGTKDTCQGDSGMGLFVKDNTINKYVLTGITSSGVGSCGNGSTGIFTKVSYHLDWILYNLK